MFLQYIDITGVEILALIYPAHPNLVWGYIGVSMSVRLSVGQSVRQSACSFFSSEPFLTNKVRNGARNE